MSERILLVALPGFSAGTIVDDATTEGVSKLARYTRAGGVSILNTPALVALAEKLGGQRGGVASTLAVALVAQAVAAGGTGGGGGAFLFQPGATQSGSLYGDWAELMEVLGGLPQGSNPIVRFLNVGAPFVVPIAGMPADGWDLRNGSLESFYRATGSVQVTIPDGVALNNCTGIQGGLQANVSPSTDDGVFRFTGIPVGAAYIFQIGQGSVVQHTGVGAMISSPGAASSTTMVLITNESITVLVPPPTGAYLKLNGNDGAVGVQMFCGPGGGLPDGWLVGGGPGSGLLRIEGIDSNAYLIPGFTGGGGTTALNGSRPRNLPYTPTTPGDWVLPLPTQVQEAIDKLAAAGGAASTLARIDCSVNAARVEQLYSATPFLHAQNGGNAAGGFNGGGVGNKAICGFDVGDGEAIGVWTGIEWTWLDLASSTPGLGVYANLIVDQNGDGSLYKVFVIDPASNPALNNGTTVVNGDGSKTTTFDPSSEFVLVVNDIVGVVPAVNLGGVFWGNRSYRVSDILAMYPAAKFKRAASADAGMPKSPTVTPAYLLVTGDSTNNRVRAFRLSGMKFDGVAV